LNNSQRVLCISSNHGVLEFPKLEPPVRLDLTPLPVGMEGFYIELWRRVSVKGYSNLPCDS